MSLRPDVFPGRQGLTARRTPPVAAMATETVYLVQVEGPGRGAEGGASVGRKVVEAARRGRASRAASLGVVAFSKSGDVDAGVRACGSGC